MLCAILGIHNISALCDENMKSQLNKKIDEIRKTSTTFMHVIKNHFISLFADNINQTLRTETEIIFTRFCEKSGNFQNTYKQMNSYSILLI